MKQTRVILTIAILVLVNTTEATVIYDDGGVHTINSDINSDVYVYNGPGDDPTIVNVVTGGSITGWLESNDNSIINVVDGLFGKGLTAYGSSQVNITDAGIGYRLYAYHNSDINILSSSIGQYVDAYDNASITIANSSIGSWLAAYGNSQFNIFNTLIGYELRAHHNSKITFLDGAVGGYIYAANNSEVDIYGGSIKDHIGANDNGVVTIYGSNFNYPLGPITVPNGLLTGTLSNGDPINVDFQISQNASIVLAPEPGTVLLVGLGGLALRRRQRV